MGGLTAVLSLALATHAVSVDKLPLRDGCDAGEPVLAELQQGDPVEIRFRLAGGDGACLKVNVESGGKKLQGYIAADGITGMEEFDRGLQAAPTASSATPRASPWTAPATATSSKTHLILAQKQVTAQSTV